MPLHPCDLLSKLNDLFKVIKEYVRTNYTALDFAKHIGLIKDVDPESIATFQLPGEAKYIGDVSYYVQDEAATREMVQRYFQPDSLPPEPEEDASDTENSADSTASEAE